LEYLNNGTLKPSPTYV